MQSSAKDYILKKSTASRLALLGSETRPGIWRVEAEVDTSLGSRLTACTYSAVETLDWIRDLSRACIMREVCHIWWGMAGRSSAQRMCCDRAVFSECYFSRHGQSAMRCSPGGLTCE